MRIHSVRIENYGPFQRLDEVELGWLATIIGQNDAGKSHILHALQLFLHDGKLAPEDIHHSAGAHEMVVIEVAFTDLPTALTLEDGSTIALQEERLLDAAGCLRLRRTWPCDGAGERGELALLTHDFGDEHFAGLLWAKERELSERYSELYGEPSANGDAAGRPSRARMRAALRAEAERRGLPLGERPIPLSARDPIRKTLERRLPRFELFETDTRLGVGEATFQSQFRPIIRAAAEDPTVVAAREALTHAIGTALQDEVEAIFTHLRRHTGALSALTARPAFSWDKAVTFEILGRDQHDIERSLDQRGSGMRRLLMVAFFQYLAEKQLAQAGEAIYAVEEPENCLHPGLQRELAASFRELAEGGVQVLLTSHSPVFAGASPVRDLVLVGRQGGVAHATPQPDRARVAEELGIEPSDQITGYSACVFVEGTSDIHFWQTIARTLRAAGYVSADFEERGIGLMPSGGGTLKHWITMRALGRLNRRFLAVMDSDRESAAHSLPESTARREQECLEQGGECIILRKREIENYLHPAALARAGYAAHPFDDFSDLKALYHNKRIALVIERMTAEELLERDRYVDESGVERHELLDVLQRILALPERARRGQRARARRLPATVPAD
ncbi:MAG TPA: AAA family ATPase [Ktedonobacterales bacterium]